MSQNKSCSYSIAFDQVFVKKKLEKYPVYMISLETDTRGRSIDADNLFKIFSIHFRRQ